MSKLTSYRSGARPATLPNVGGNLMLSPSSDMTTCNSVLSHAVQKESNWKKIG